jgi:ATP-binding cassette subfamily B protein
MKIQPGRYWNLLGKYLKPRRRQVLFLALLLFCTTGLQLAHPQIVRYFIDAARGGGALDVLIGAAVLFLGVALFQEIVAVSATYVGENLAWSATNSLRRDLAVHVIRLDMSFHNARTPGELIERIDGDVTALANFFSQFVIRVLGNALLLVGILFLLFIEEWRVGLALAALAAVGLVVLDRLRDLATPHWVLGRQSSAEFAGFLEERLAGTEDIRANGAVPYKMRLLFGFMRQLMERYRRARLTGHFNWMFGNLLAQIGLAIGLGMGAYLYTQGAITIGTVFLISLYAGMLSEPMRRITDELQDLQKAGASIERVEDLYRTPITIQDGPGTPLPTGAPQVDFEHVSFGYAGGVPVLEDVSFTLASGAVLGLLGRTGSGKTTITRLLLRLYDPTEGTIRLGGVDIRDARLSDLRRHVGMVTQEVQLFHATVRENLTLFDRTIPDERILAAVAQLGLLGWYRALPDGLDTHLTSSAGLSAGEAQLLAFTRVFLRDPSLVILDEASSRLDPATERLIEHAIDALMKGRTAIIVAHRLGTVQRADEILILESGRIAEHGKRADLARDPASRFSYLLRTGLEDGLHDVQVVMAGEAEGAKDVPA